MRKIIGKGDCNASERHGDDGDTKAARNDQPSRESPYKENTARELGDADVVHALGTLVDPIEDVTEGLVGLEDEVDEDHTYGGEVARGNEGVRDDDSEAEKQGH